MRVVDLVLDAPQALNKIREGITWVTRHTGIPAVVVAAIIIVASVRFLKTASRVLIEVAVVAALFFAATKLGWLTW